MKKILFLLATATIIVFSSCSEDECDHIIGQKNDYKEIVGLWYAEDDNEEIHYSESGTFYDRYCILSRSEETEGRYEYDKANKKLAYRYTFLGQNRQTNWTIKELTEFKLTLQSDKDGKAELEKVVETFNLNVGETKEILFSKVYPQYSVSSYTSLNERLASVNNGIIKAEGEKGTTYIKMQTTAGVVWIKVVVGSDQLDLWYNFHSLIDCDYKTITDKLGAPNLTGDKYSFGYRFDDTHETAVELDIFINKNSNTVEQMSLLLKNTVPTSKILSYLESKYYLLSISNGTYVYSTSISIDNSIGLVQYEPSNNQIGFFSLTQIPEPESLWDDYTLFFGKNATDILSILGEPIYDLGTSYYFLVENEYIGIVEFSFDPITNLVYESSVIINSTADLQEILNYLTAKYYYYEKGSDPSLNSFAFINKEKIEDSTIGIVFDANNLIVSFVDLTYSKGTRANRTYSIEINGSSVDYSCFIN